MTRSYNEFFELVEEQLQASKLNREPKELYEPMGYMLGLGGKRLRPVLVLMANDLFKGAPGSAIHAAAAIEVFHNFTLVHDDIMDEAPLRRGQQTIHEKWDQTVGILSGDLMMIHSIDLLCKTPVQDLRALINVFTKAAAEVCEGQQIDMNFEKRNDVSVGEYISMITLKTAVLLGASLKIGALIGGASAVDAGHLYDFGTNIGLAFQIQDDILDSFGEGAQVGKKIGGDIVANKKTLLYLEALEQSDESTKGILRKIYSSKPADENEKIQSVLAIFQKANVLNHAEKLKAEYLNKAFNSLEAVNVNEGDKETLRNTAVSLMQRIS